MIRKVLLVAAAVAMPVGIIAASGTAGAGGPKPVTDVVTAPATASCTVSGGTLTFAHPIGIAVPGGYVPPAKNKGNKIAVAGVNLSCTSSAVSGTFTGVASGKVTTTNPTETAATFYSCTNLTGISPQPGGTVVGSLKVTWTAPVGQKFSSKSSKIAVTSIGGGTATLGGDTYGSFTIPGNPGTGNIVGAFPGSDTGASSTVVAYTSQDEVALTNECVSTSGLGSVTLGSGTTAGSGSLQ
jgi:hypothetical protein